MNIMVTNLCLTFPHLNEMVESKGKGEMEM